MAPTGNIHDFVLDGKSYRPVDLLLKYQTNYVVSDVRITMLVSCTNNIASNVCGRRCFVTN